MKLVIQILILFFLFNGALIGQIRFPSKKKKSDRFESLIQRIETDEVNVINELSIIIEKANNEEDLLTLYKANKILGDINFKNKFYALAVQRYIQSYDIEKSIGIQNGRTVSEKLGETYLALKDKRALNVYNLCILESKDPNQILLCKEGLSNAYYNNKEYGAAINLLKDLENVYAQTDSSQLARIQALIAKNALSQNNFKDANFNISNAYQNLKNSSKKDYKVIQKSKEKVFTKQNKEIDKEAFLINSVKVTKKNPEIQAVEKLDLIKIQIEKGDYSKADKSIEEVKLNINSITDLEVKAQIFKQSSTSNALQGDYETALSDYKKFEENQFALLSQKEENINKRLSVLESQKDIEITEKTFTSRKNLYIAEQKSSNIQRYIIYLLALLLLGTMLAGLTIWRNLRAKNILNKKLQLQSLRAQMNPHFIFNALNSVNEFIASQDEKKANKYLSDFSKLMRSVLEVSQKETIDIADEIRLSELYLLLEQDRFKDKFEHEVIVDQHLRNSEVQIPPLLLQPFLENAIWHGLRYRDTKGKLIVHIYNEADHIQVTIKDNGIGRKNSIAQKTKFQKQQESTGMKNSKARMDIVEKLYGNSFKLDVRDAFEDAIHPGTLVTITFSKN